MSVTQYIGARYVPIFAEPDQWSSDRAYEPLTIVLHEGNSFTSKQAVPIGIEITNTQYWAQTANYNAQVEAYRREVQQFAGDIENATDLANEANEAVASETAAREEAIAAETAARETAVNEIQNQLDNIVKFNVVDNAYLGVNMSFYGSIEFNTNPYGDIHNMELPCDYVNGAAVMGDMLYTYSDPSNSEYSGVIRKFNLGNGTYAGERVVVGVNTHPASMSADGGYIYICGSEAGSTNTLLFKVDASSLNLHSKIYLNERLYAVKKTVNPSTENGEWVGYSRTEGNLKHFNVVGDQIEIVKTVEVNGGFPKTTNGMCLVRDDKYLAINSINATSTAVIDIETGQIIGECAIATQDSPCELEDSFWYRDDYYLVFSVNEHHNYKRNSNSIGFCKMRLFSDARIDSDSNSWLPLNGFNSVSCSHLPGQVNFIGDGSSANPLMSITFALGMLNQSSSGIRIDIADNSVHYNFPLLRQSNNVYIVGQNAEINDSISIQNGAFLRIYLKKLSGYIKASSTSVSCLASNLHVNIDEYSTEPDFSIRANYSIINCNRNPNPIKGIYFTNSQVNWLPEGTAFNGSVTCINSDVVGLPLYNNTQNLVDYIKNGDGCSTIVVKVWQTDTHSRFTNILLTNNPANSGTFTGAAFNTYENAIFGMRLYASENSIVSNIFNSATGQTVSNYEIGSAFTR